MVGDRPDQAREPDLRHSWARASFGGKTRLQGAVFSLIGIAEFAILPLLSLFITPLLVHRLGTESYGLWITATALTLAVNLVSFGLPDWLVVTVGAARARPDWQHTIPVLWGDTLILGACAAAVGLAVAPLLLVVTALHGASIMTASASSLVVFTATAAAVRSFEILMLGLVRGCERWDLAGAIGIGSRLANIANVVGFALLGKSVAVILAGQNLISILAFVAYSQVLRSEIGCYPKVMRSPRSRLVTHLREARPFWTQVAVSGIVHSLDRVVVSGFFGLSAVTGYAVCSQVTQQIYTASWSAANWIVPRVARLSASAQYHRVALIERWGWILGTALGFLAVAVLGGFGAVFLRAWMGPSFASEWSGLLIVLGVTMALFAVPIVPWYVVQAIGLAKTLVPVYVAGLGFGVCAFAITKNFVGVESVAIGRGAVAVAILIGVAAILKRASERRRAIEQAA